MSNEVNPFYIRTTGLDGFIDFGNDLIYRLVA